MQDLKPKDFKTFVKEELGLGVWNVCTFCGGGDIDCIRIQNALLGTSLGKMMCWFPKGTLVVWNVEEVCST